MAYEIILKNETAKKKSPIAGDDGSGQKEGGNGAIASAGASKKTVAAAKGLAVFKTQIQPFIDNIVTHQISTVSLRTGSDELQERLSFAYSVGKQVAGVLESVAMGAMVGQGVGAIIGAVFGIVNVGLNYAQKADTLRLQKANEDVSLQFQAIRRGGGLSTYSGSRGQRQ